MCKNNLELVTIDLFHKHQSSVQKINQQAVKGNLNVFFNGNNDKYYGMLILIIFHYIQFIFPCRNKR